MNRLKQVSIYAILVTMVCGLSMNGMAQKVIFCEGYSNTGIPKKEAEVFVVDSLPYRVQILYNNGKTTIANSKVNFLIEPEERLQMDAEKVFVNVSQGRNWVVLEKEFEAAGRYAVSVFTPKNEIMAGSMITIKLTGNAKPKEIAKTEKPVKVEKAKTVVKKEPVVKKEAAKASTPREINPEPKKKEPKRIETGFNPAEKVEITEEDKKTLHYDGVKLVFGSSLSNGKMEGASNTFSKNKGRVKVMTQLMNPQPLKTEKIQADFWMKSNTGEFDELVVSEEHDANPRSYKAYFTTDLFKSGEYKVSVYTEDFVWIASSYLTVE